MCLGADFLFFFPSRCRSIQYCLEQPPSQSAAQKDTRESRRGGLAACLNQLIPAPALLSMEGCGEQNCHTQCSRRAEMLHTSGSYGYHCQFIFLHSEHSIQCVMFPQSHKHTATSELWFICPLFSCSRSSVSGLFPPNASGVFISKNS